MTFQLEKEKNSSAKSKMEFQIKSTLIIMNLLMKFVYLF